MATEASLIAETQISVVFLADATARLDAAGIDSPRLTAELLLAAAIGIDRTALYTRLREPIAPAVASTFSALLLRRLKREPLQYLVGHQEFWSLDFVVSPDVLIPRPETELIVERALVTYPAGREGRRLDVCDVGTGSGCLAVTLAHEWPGARVTALDVSAAALRIAAVNAQRGGVAERVRFVQSDLFSALDTERFDLIVSNPPYVSRGDLATAQPELGYEPQQALAGGVDGLNVIRRLLTGVPRYLLPGGWLFMEIGADQGDVVLELARAAGATGAVVERDYAGLPRVLRGQW